MNSSSSSIIVFYFAAVKMNDEIFFNIDFFDIFKLKSADFGNFFLLLLTEYKIAGAEQTQTEFNGIGRNNVEDLHPAHRFDLTGGADKRNALQSFLN